jgi:pimeloyl-ACP methyl ester carboxylesterase
MSQRDNSVTFEHVRSADGLPIGYARFGSGPALVIVHGTIHTAAEWFPVARLLAETHTVYVMERRGRGHSHDEGKPYGLQREIEDVAAIARLAGPGAALFGHSFGGLLVLAYVLQSGFAGDAVLYEGVHGLFEGWSDVDTLPAEERLKAGDAEAALLALYHAVYRGAGTEQLAKLRECVSWQVQVAHTTTAIREVKVLREFAPTVADCAGVKARVTLLMGTAPDNYPPVGSAQIVERILGTTLLPIRGQDHYCHFWNPKLMSRMIRKSLEVAALEEGEVA